MKGIVPNPPGFVFPGLAAQPEGDSPKEMTRKLKEWNIACQKEFGVPMQGAWLWNYDAILKNNSKSFDAYVQALKAGWV